MNKAVIIDQYALYSALGTLGQTAGALLAGQSALQPPPCFDLPVAHAPFDNPALRIPEKVFPLLNNSMRKLPERPFFIYAAAKGDIRSCEPASYRTGGALPSPGLSGQADRIAASLGITPRRTEVISNACASGAAAVARAKDLLETGSCTEVLIAGFDVISCFVTSGFFTFGALSASGARPFDKNRDGLSLGDGAVLTVLRMAEPRNGDIVIAGTGQSNDANHRTGPSRTGDGLYRAASGALNDARHSPDQIGAVKCHGTATAYNDAMESKALQRLFDNTPPPCFSVKGGIGHTSGAGSLLELLLAAEFLKRRSIPPTIRFSEPDPEAALPVKAAVQCFSAPSLLCLSAGFGGLNAAVVLTEAAA